MSEKIRAILLDIRFWIILLFVVRLIGITNPPLESAHNWRQTTGNMVSRNFLEIDNNILYPRIDHSGDKTGISGMEFPLLNYLIYLVSEIFGYEHWYGRLINLIISSLGIFFFYKLLNKYFNPKIAFNATMVFLFSIWFAYSRKIMPDTFSVSFILAALYYGSNYLDSKTNYSSTGNLILYVLMVTLGMLSKLPSGYLLIIFILFILNQEISVKRKIIFSAVSLISLLPPLTWYFYWAPHLSDTYGVLHFFKGNSLMEGIQEIRGNLVATMGKFYESALKYIGFIVFIYGIFHLVLKKNKRLIYIFAISSFGFLIVMVKIGLAFPHHGYYIIPFVPVMALITGYALDNIKSKVFAMILLVVICLEGGVNQYHDFIIPDKKMMLLNLENDLDNISNRNDLILINSVQNTTPMYFSHHRGWSSSNEQIMNKGYISNLKKNGLKLIVILKHTFGSEVVLDLPIAFQDENYCIYKL